MGSAIATPIGGRPLPSWSPVVAACSVSGSRNGIGPEQDVAGHTDQQAAVGEDLEYPRSIAKL